MNDLLRKTEEDSKKNLEEYVGMMNVKIIKNPFIEISMWICDHLLTLRFFFPACFS